MTTGSTVTDRRVPLYDPAIGTANVGDRISKTWTGGDAIKPAKPRASYSKMPRPRRTVEVMVFSRKSQKYRLKPRSVIADTKPLEIRKRPKKPKLKLPPQTYSMVKTIEFYNPLKCSDSPKGPAYFTRGPSDPFITVSLDPAQEYKVIEKLRTKVYGSGFNPAIFAAEGQKAISMIGDNAFALRLALGSLVRKDWKGLAAALNVDRAHARKVIQDPRGTLSNKWLQLQYGWLPVVSDMEAGAQWLAEAVNNFDAGATKVSARRTFETDERITAGSTQYAFTRKVTTFKLQYIIYGVQTSPVYLPSLATVASVAWEKLPYSFVADWVVPISSYLQAMRTASDIRGTVVRTLTTDSLWMDPKTGSGIYGFGNMSGILGPPRKRVITMARTISSEISPPSPLGGIANDSSFLSWRRAYSAIALLAQRRW